MNTRFLKAGAAALVAGAYLLPLCALRSEAKDESPALFLAGSARNDLYRALRASGASARRFDAPREAVRRAAAGDAVLILADGYSERPTPVPADLYAQAAAKRLRLYVEFPTEAPGLRPGPPQGTTWERLVVATDRFGASLPRRRILALPDCRYLPAELPAGAEPLLVSARVAGFDQAVYGLPPQAAPILYQVPGQDVLVSTTRLSGMVAGRYAPQREWQQLWAGILRWLQPERPERELTWTPSVRPAYGPGAALPADVENSALRSGVRWFHRSGLLLSPERVPAIHRLLKEGKETVPVAASGLSGDGSHGILEGYASGILHDGSQLQRLPLRADCQAESAMSLAAAGPRDTRSRKVAKNLLDYLYGPRGMQTGVRGDPRHPAYGLIAWGSVAPAWEVGNYGDDAARTMLATALTATWLDAGDWDRPVVRGLLANLRTTGRLGFRGDRVDIPALEQRGWRAFHEAETVNLSPHFEAYLWACNLWAYRATGDREFLDRTRSGIRRTMEAYPPGWRWGDNLDRARMVLALAWLVRVEDTPEHQSWLARVTDDLLKQQQPNGALAEQVNEQGGGGHFRVPPSNEAYGTGETPLIQRNGDPVSDQLYTTGFALIGLHEAVAATGTPRWQEAEDRLAGYLCRIQVRAPQHPYLDGAWFRAFDYGRWDYWASSGDIGWGPWCMESGWGQAWILATLALRQQRTSAWDLIARRPLGKHLAEVRAEMARNSGGPWR